jgi:hypothetical protein
LVIFSSLAILATYVSNVSVLATRPVSAVFKVDSIAFTRAFKPVFAVFKSDSIVPTRFAIVPLVLISSIAFKRSTNVLYVPCALFISAAKSIKLVVGFKLLSIAFKRA